MRTVEFRPRPLITTKVAMNLTKTDLSANNYRLSKMPPKKQVKITYIERTVTTKETRKEVIDKPAPKSYGACYRCGRTSHYSPDCYASTHVRGYELDD